MAVSVPGITRSPGNDPGYRRSFDWQLRPHRYARSRRPADVLIRPEEVSRIDLSLAERFTRFAGEPPIQYLGRWRMQVAAGLIASGVSLGAVAERVGYGSEAAFQRAFKKHVGTSPGDWRRRARSH